MADDGAPAGVAPAPSASASLSSWPEPAWGRRWERRSRPSAVISAPSAATPNVPPTIRVIDRIPEATPAFVTGTAFIAAVLIGDMTRPMPTPIIMNGTTRNP